MGINPYLGRRLPLRPCNPSMTTKHKIELARHQRSMRGQRVFSSTEMRNKASLEISVRTPTTKPAVMDASLLWDRDGPGERGTHNSTGAASAVVRVFFSMLLCCMVNQQLWVVSRGIFYSQGMMPFILSRYPRDLCRLGHK